MSSLLYKGHSITTEATRDEITGKYKPVVHVTWKTTDGRHTEHSFTLPSRCSTFNEANTRAFAEAKAWADRRLIHWGRKR
jgi:membrane-bound lytic murein transglycosylase